MLHMAEGRILPNQRATLADCQALQPSRNEVLHVNYLLLLCPRPRDNAQPGARKGFLGCTLSTQEGVTKSYSQMGFNDLLCSSFIKVLTSFEQAGHPACTDFIPSLCLAPRELSGTNCSGFTARQTTGPGCWTSEKAPSVPLPRSPYSLDICSSNESAWL